MLSYESSGSALYSLVHYSDKKWGMVGLCFKLAEDSQDSDKTLFIVLQESTEPDPLPSA